MAELKNLVFILTDQQRWDALGVAGSAYVSTPNLDTLARQGVRFSHTYASQAVCSPSRATIISGLFPTSHGVTDNVTDTDDCTTSADYRLSVTWPRLLQQASITTGYIGKWHLGVQPPPCFDEWYGWNTGKPHWMGEEQRSQYRSDFETDQAIEFLRRHRGGRFALYLSFYPPHTPYTAPEKFVEPYRRTPLRPAEYYGAVSAIDANVGRVMAALGELGLAEETLVVFTSDHGDHFGTRPGNPHKRGAYDDCARVPLIVRLPGTAGGCVRPELVSNVDLMPTILDLMGLEVPTGLHGESLAPLLNGKRVPWRSAVCIQNREGLGDDAGAIQSRGVRTRDWKLVLRESLSNGANDLRELYDLRSDPSEQHSLYGDARAETVASLLLELDYWARSIGDRTTIRLTAACARDLGLA